MGRDDCSVVNQRILRDFVDREVIMCATDIVEYILQSQLETGSADAPFSEEDIKNRYRKTCSKCGGDLEEIEPEDVEIQHCWISLSWNERFETKEEALKCFADDQDNIEGLEESDMVREVWICPFCDEEYDSEEEARDCSCTYGETLYRCKNCGEYFTESGADVETNEAYEWHFVSNYLANKLEQHGEMVIKGWHNVWGRGSSGQAIYLDGVIGQIAEEMEILDGQSNSWAKKVS